MSKALAEELKMGAGSWDVGEKSFPGTNDLLVPANEKQVRGMISPDSLYCLIIS